MAAPWRQHHGAARIETWPHTPAALVPPRSKHGIYLSATAASSRWTTSPSPSSRAGSPDSSGQTARGTVPAGRGGHAAWPGQEKLRGAGAAEPDALEAGEAGRDAPDIDRAFELVDAAQRTAREAIAELRNLARGIHPPALDRGLDAALATLAARSMVPVDLVVGVPRRPSPAIETIAYFCTAELLANVAKHSTARRAMVEVVHVPGLLRVRVSDDGPGGARPVDGSGLAGLAERVRTVDGHMDVSSPAGGPTVVTVELPSHA